MEPDTDVEIIDNNMPPPHDVVSMDDDDDHDDDAVTIMTSQSKRWIVTAWASHMGPEWTPRDIDVTDNGIDYLCWGFERAPKTGREHYHIYFRFHQKKKLSTLIRMLGSNQVKCFFCKGNEKECTDYCHKIGKHIAKNPHTISIGWVGEMDPSIGRGKGHRSDIDDVIAAVEQEGANATVLANRFPNAFIRMGRGIQDWLSARRLLPPLIRLDFQILYFWGDSGVGKSYRVKMDPIWSQSLYVVPDGPHPWDGYADQTTILLDEWNSENWPLNQMNNYLDPYRLELSCRYRNKYAAWSRVVICSNYSPSQAYAHIANATARAAFSRRLKDHQACRYIDKRQDEGGPSLQEIIDSPPNPVL